MSYLQFCPEPNLYLLILETGMQCPGTSVFSCLLFLAVSLSLQLWALLKSRKWLGLLCYSSSGILHRPSSQLKLPVRANVWDGFSPIMMTHSLCSFDQNSLPNGPMNLWPLSFKDSSNFLFRKTIAFSAFFKLNYQSDR